MAKSQSKKSGDRKHGRTTRSPAHKRYNNEERWAKNKERRIAKEKKRQAKLKARKNARNIT